MLIAPTPIVTESTSLSFPFVTFVRAPIVSALKSVNNEATPSIAYAYLAAYIQKRGYQFAIVDGIASGLNRIWRLSKYPGYQCQGLTFEKGFP